MPALRSRPVTDQTLVVATPADPLAPPVPPLIMTVLGPWVPHSPLLPRRDGWLSPPYPPETGAGFRSAPGPGTGIVEQPEQWFDDLPFAPDRSQQLDHFALRARDGLLAPYAAGMKDGKRYVRVIDIPAMFGLFFLRRDEGRWVPFEAGVGWFSPTELSPALYEGNATVRLGVETLSNPRPAYPLGGTLQGNYYGAPVFDGTFERELLAEVPFRDLYRAVAAPSSAQVTRHYQNGQTETEPLAVPALDLTLHPPAIPSLGEVRRPAWYTVYSEFLEANINSYYQRGELIVDFAQGVTRQGLDDYRGQVTSRLVWRLGARVQITEGPLTPRDELVVSTWMEPRLDRLLACQVLRMGLGSNVARSPDLPESFPLRARYWNDGGRLASWDEAPLTLGRLLYEGPLGTLPAPASGLRGVWCGLEVVASSHFTADAWLEGAELLAVIAYADGRVQLSRQGTEPGPAGPVPQGPVRTWRGRLGDVTDQLPTGTPVCTYAFMQPGWPFGAGSLAWADGELGLLQPYRARRQGSAPRLLPELGEGGSGVSYSKPLVRHALPRTRYAPPEAGLPPELLSRLAQPAPHEPGGGRRPTLVRLGPVTLGFPDTLERPGEVGRSEVDGVQFVTTVAAARAFQPAEGQVQVSRVRGRGYAAVEWRFSPQPRTGVRLLFSPDLPVGHLRARLRATYFKEA